MAATAHGGTAVSGREGTVQINAAVSGGDHKTEDAIASSQLMYRVTQWTLEASSSPFEWADSDSDGYSNRASTKLGATGSVTVKLDTGRYLYAMFSEGDFVDLSLFIRKGETPPLGYNLPRAQIENLSWTVDPNSQEPIEVSFNYGNDGVYYTPTHTGNPDPTLLTN